MSIKMMISSTRIATTIPMMGPVPSSSDPVQNANILSNSLLLTEKEQNESIMSSSEHIN
jgi:anthranilate/para-aminobenzoate synthase component I